MIEAVGERESWDLEEGAEIAPGRSVLQPLGGGYDYEVYLVWDDRLFSVLVAKLLRPHLVGRERSLWRLAREAELLARLAHPVVLRGFGAAVEGEYPHLLLEHLEGPTLKRLIRRGGPLPPEQLLPLALHVASALHYLAMEEIVHLDVKPDNIVMGIPPRLIDMSIARPVQDARDLKVPVGTNAYMAPEQCAPGEAGEIGSPADVWGLAATLFHALSGRTPFSKPASTTDDASPQDRYPQLAEEVLEPDRALPPGLIGPVMAALAKKPADRPTAAELALAFQPEVAALPKKIRLGRRGGI